MKLSLLSILLGVGMSVPQVYGLASPQKFAASVRKFPRNLPVGIVLTLLATAWFLWNVNGETLADYSAYKPEMMIAFAAIGILTCVYVQDFLAVRGLAVLFLLLAKLMVDAGRPHLPTALFQAQAGESSWVLVIQVWAYVLVIAGIWFTVAPWRLRDFLNWATATESRVKIGSAIRLAFALFIVLLGLTAFRAM
ncbi:MAG TPA: hypothetical protein VHG89_12290 [Verrucomicrobiae bacterium]|nr:hypothetical protein [Verrucomicrobiae bacterium]